MLKHPPNKPVCSFSDPHNINVFLLSVSEGGTAAPLCMLIMLNFSSFNDFFCDKTLDYDCPSRLSFHLEDILSVPDLLQQIQSTFS